MATEQITKLNSNSLRLKSIKSDKEHHKVIKNTIKNRNTKRKKKKVIEKTINMNVTISKSNMSSNWMDLCKVSA